MFLCFMVFTCNRNLIVPILDFSRGRRVGHESRKEKKNKI